jgi:hypothetical protein
MRRARVAIAMTAIVVCTVTVAPAHATQSPTTPGIDERSAAWRSTSTLLAIADQPALTLAPSAAVKGTPTTITATQTDVGGSDVTLTYPTGATPVTMPSGPNNTNVLSFAADVSTCGPATVTVNWPVIFLRLDPSTTPGTDSAVFTVLCPTITLDPAVVYGAGGATTVNVTATDFDLGDDDSLKQLTFDGAPATPTAQFGPKQPISFTAGGSCGPHQVELTQQSAFGLLDATAVFTVECPTVALDPGTIAQVLQPAGVGVDATSFPPNAAVTISLDGTTVGSGQTDQFGTLATAITANNLDCGTYPVVVETDQVAGVPHARAKAHLVVSCAPLVQADPDVVQAGMTTHITGSGFTPGAQVTLVWQLPDGTTEPVAGSPRTASASDKGTFDFYTLIPGLDELGLRMLAASDGNRSATAKVLIEGGTMQPSGGQVVGIIVRR